MFNKINRSITRRFCSCLASQYPKGFPVNTRDHSCASVYTCQTNNQFHERLRQYRLLEHLYLDQYVLKFGHETLTKRITSASDLPFWIKITTAFAATDWQTS